MPYSVSPILKNYNTDCTDFHRYVFYQCASALSVQSVFNHNITLSTKPIQLLLADSGYWFGSDLNGRQDSP